VRHQLRQRAAFPQQRVDEQDGLVLGHLPQPLKARPERADGVKLGLITGAGTRDGPLRDQAVECGEVGQFLVTAAGGVDQSGGRVQCQLRVMGKKHLTYFTTLR
jgi:hypothetical protein